VLLGCILSKKVNQGQKIRKAGRTLVRKRRGPQEGKGKSRYIFEPPTKQTSPKFGFLAPDFIRTTSRLNEPLCVSREWGRRKILRHSDQRAFLPQQKIREERNGEMKKKNIEGKQVVGANTVEALRVTPGRCVGRSRPL